MDYRSQGIQFMLRSGKLAKIDVVEPDVFALIPAAAFSQPAAPATEPAGSTPAAGPADPNAAATVLITGSVVDDQGNIRPGKMQRLVYRLKRDSKWVTGRILNPDGTPAAGVTIGVYPKLAEEYTASGSDGSFALGTSVVPEEKRGSAVVIARDVQRNLVGLAKMDTTQPVEIRLSKGVTLSGQVVDAKGKPFPGVSMLLLAPAKEGSFGGSGYEWCIVSGPDGRFEVKAVAPGLRYAISASAAGRERVALVVDVPADSSGREVKIEPIVMRTEGF
jgi:hypothetical protein